MQRSYHQIARVLLIFCSAYSAPVYTAGIQAAQRPTPKIQSSPGYTVSLNWQMMRSRPQSSLAGTITESYVLHWDFVPKLAAMKVTSSYGSFELQWVPDPQDIKAGQLTMTRAEFVRLLGLEQELPQDPRLWQADSPLILTIQSREGRAIEPVFRHSDDNGMVLIRMSARVASLP